MTTPKHQPAPEYAVVGHADHSQNLYTLALPMYLYVGFTAKELRELGAELPENIPDCAEMQINGTFKWIDISFTVTGDEIKE